MSATTGFLLLGLWLPGRTAALSGDAFFAILRGECWITKRSSCFFFVQQAAVRVNNKKGRESERVGEK